MASTKAYLDFVLEQLSGLDEISSREMMGEFILYYRMLRWNRHMMVRKK